MRALARLNADGDVRFAEPDAPVEGHTADTHWSLLWGLHNTGQFAGSSADADIDAPEAWAQSTGTGQTVAVVDSGAMLTQEDLTGQFATNPGESGGGRETNGLDDDASGYVDDYRGWDFVGADDNDPGDAHGHGTHVSGTIAAKKDNNAGIAGVAPAAKLLPLRVLGATNSGFTSDTAAAFALAGRLNIPIVNASIGSTTATTSQRDAIAAHPNTLYVVSAGNGGDDDIGDDNDVTPVYPCALNLDNVICVGASTWSDTRATFSNYGSTSVDIFAPGQNVYSTWLDGGASCPGVHYCYFSGTSMAAPHVAGILALMRARAPSLSAAQLKALLLSSGDPKPALAGLSVTGRRVNAAAAVAAAAAAPLDTDLDGVVDGSDNCVSVANAGQADLDGDGSGDACDSDDDGDGVADATDNCATVSNVAQLNSDADALGNACDTDDDNDTILDGTDNCPTQSNPGQADLDGDGSGDACDPTPRGGDPDGDGRAELDDNCDTAANFDQSDRDGDGIGDVCDPTPDGPLVTAAQPESARPLSSMSAQPVPATTLGTTPPPVPAPLLVTPPQQVRAPRLGRPSLSRTTITRRRSATLRFTLDRAATVHLTARRRAGAAYRAAGAVRRNGAAGANRYTLKLRFDGRALRRGSYTLKVAALDGTLASRAYTLRFTVR